MVVVLELLIGKLLCLQWIMIINYNFTYHAGFDIISRRSLSQTYTMLY